VATYQTLLPELPNLATPVPRNPGEKSIGPAADVVN
jgi:hypothetical protein